MDKVTSPQLTILCSLLRQMRMEAGLRQVDLASELEKPQSYVSKYESGNRNLDIMEVVKICTVLNVKFSDFAHRLEELL